ncbi:hypothetical protein [Cytophaga sp. FL35]|uniref:hypothetical protein n=1 Tax=Cytophaga sp. FL35 TaxID=1904456 RepID=UPI00165376D2|nr:hypothetical protein [Cytophaga sp. FL35]MBC7000882.1 hypothetical protein [Cytophaga sp. FL35]
MDILPDNYRSYCRPHNNGLANGTHPKWTGNHRMTIDAIGRSALYPDRSGHSIAGLGILRLYHNEPGN